MQPIKEYGNDAYFTRLYWDNVKTRKQLGNIEPADGAKFCGRGFVQLTGRRNYTIMTPIVQSFYPACPDFTEKPSAVMEDNYAAVIMFYGMFCGSFTGKALKNYIGDPNQGQIVDFYNARRVILGLNKASEIQVYAKKFDMALDQAQAQA